MKTTTTFPLYHLPGTSLGTLAAVLSGLGLEAWPLGGEAPVGTSLLLLVDGQQAPAGWEEWAVQVPVDGSPSALRALLQVAMENAVLKTQVREFQAAGRRQHQQFEELNRIGIALSSERDIDKLQDLILRTCRQLTKADGATLYLIEEAGEGERKLRFAWSQTASVDVPYSSFVMPLTEKSMGGYTILSGMSQLVDDAYTLPADVPFGFNRSFDEQHGYRTRSMLCTPMRNHTGDVVGAIQLINAKRSFETQLTPQNIDAEVVSFQREDLEMIESIASQAAVALDNKMLLDSIQALFEGFVKASVTAIESRDPTTYGHSGRVAVLTVSLAEEVTRIGAGAYKDLHFTADQLKELRYASLLHDFGKIGVREHVLVKEKKLYPGQLDYIKERFAFVERSVQLQYTQEKLKLALEGGATPEALAEVDGRLQKDLADMDDWLRQLTAANEPSVLDEDKASTLGFLALRQFTDLSQQAHPLLEPDEFHFLSIKRGTLDEKERLEIESHVTNSYKFLTKIPWTPAMRDVPRIAYGHHEKLDGTGYPRRLKAAEIPVQTRMMTISDIYDALTAQDRPYKRAVPLDRALEILRTEAAEGKLDQDLLDVFIARRVFVATENYRPDQDLLLGGGQR